MRETMADPALVRLAGQFVWLELDFDKPVNQDFIARHGVAYTPSLFVLKPGEDRPAATHIGGMPLADLTRFLEEGRRKARGTPLAPADAALARGDEAAGLGRMADAASEYRRALSLAGKGWGGRERAVRALTWSLMTGRQYRPCAETAAKEAPGMSRGALFAGVVLSGLSCANQGGGEPSGVNVLKTLEPLAAEAAALPATLRDERFQLYQQLMHAADARGDTAALERWGAQWLADIETAKPASDDERSALDIARVDAVSLLKRPASALPALEASEKAMPGNYNASLRLAQMATDAKRYDEAVAACDRGLVHVTGPIGRAWLLQTKAEALAGKGDAAGARAALQEALTSAREIGQEPMRSHTVERITRALSESARPPG
jgi:tetratricopeptide (TPR) repeat protein